MTRFQRISQQHPGITSPRLSCRRWADTGRGYAAEGALSSPPAPIAGFAGGGQDPPSAPSLTRSEPESGTDFTTQAPDGPAAPGVLSFHFRARVYGIMDGAVYLSGRTGEDDASAVSVMIPLDGPRPQLGDEVRVKLRVVRS